MCPHHQQERETDRQLHPALPSSPLRSLPPLVLAVASLVLLLRYTSLPLPSLSTLLPSSLLLLLAFLTLLLYRTFTFPNRQLAHPPPPPPFFASAQSHFHSTRHAMASRLATALTFPTISHDDPSRIDPQPLLALHQHLRSAFPLVHSRMELTVINRYSLLYKMTGTDESFPHSPLTSPHPDLPLLFLAHLDVVPAPDPHLWRHPPFSPTIHHNRIHGRGAIDDKNNVCALLEACEWLLEADLRPKRSLYLAFGHDEEVGGGEGARMIAKHLKGLGVRFEWSLDEGLFIVDGVVPGYRLPVALVCTGEKGQLSVELSVQLQAKDAGHSAAPGRDSAIAILSGALTRLHRSVMPAYYGQREREMMEWLAHGLPFPLRVLVSNLWCFAPLLRYVMQAKPQTATAVRTTTALTVVRGGDKLNVVPHAATAIVNHRIHPADSCDGVLRFDRAVIADPRVQVSSLRQSEASSHSSSSSPAFRAVHESVVTVFPHVSVAPCLMVAGTDTRHYEAAGLCDAYLRFSVTQLTKDELSMFHGRDESIDVDNYANTALFYATIILKCDKQDWGEAAGAQPTKTSGAKKQFTPG